MFLSQPAIWEQGGVLFYGFERKRVDSTRRRYMR